MPAKVIMITGCSSGIGKSLAEEASRRGFTVYATARQPDSLQSLDRQIRRLQLDITDPASVRQAVATVGDEVGRLDYLINNAGHSLFGPLAEVPLEKVTQLLHTNLTSQLAMCQAVIPLMAASRAGCIANVGSMVGVVATPFSGAYSASKAALHVLSEALRMEVAPLGIDVVVIQPGAVASRVADNAKANSELDRYRSERSLYRAIHPHILRRADLSQRRPMPADTFARRVWDQLSRRRPPDVIQVGQGVTALRFLARLPRGVRDLVLSRFSGLHKLDVR